LLNNSSNPVQLINAYKRVAYKWNSSNTRFVITTQIITKCIEDSQVINISLPDIVFYFVYPFLLLIFELVGDKFSASDVLNPKTDNADGKTKDGITQGLWLYSQQFLKRC